MATAPHALTIKDCYISIRSFILGLIDTEVIRGYQNNASVKTGGFITMNVLFSERLATNVTRTKGIGNDTKDSRQDSKIAIQLDFYGELSSSWAQIISTMWRDEYAVNAMKDTLAPLHTDTARMIPIVSAENQYNERWTLTVYAHYQPVTTTTPLQHFENIGTINYQHED